MSAFAQALVNSVQSIRLLERVASTRHSPSIVADGGDAGVARAGAERAAAKIAGIAVEARRFGNSSRT